MANNQNLKPWKPGQSGNPAGKPKGTVHVSTLIREMLADETAQIEINSLKYGKRKFTGPPIKAIIEIFILRAAHGDARSFDLLCKYGYGTKVDVTSDEQRIVIPILSGLSKPD